MDAHAAAVAAREVDRAPVRDCRRRRRRVWRRVRRRVRCAGGCSNRREGQDDEHFHDAVDYGLPAEALLATERKTRAASGKSVISVQPRVQTWWELPIEPAVVFTVNSCAFGIMTVVEPPVAG